MFLISEWIAPQGLTWLVEHGIEFEYHPTLHENPDVLCDYLKTACALIVRNQTQVNARLLSRAPYLRAIGRLGVGLDNIDVNACRERNIQIITARGANAPAVVEFVVSALLWHYRPWTEWVEETRRGQWNRRHGGGELLGKTVGIVGLGDIGRRVAETLLTFGCHLWGYDPRVGPYDSLVSTHHMQKVQDLSVLLAQSDVVTLHAQLTPKTRHLINESALDVMRQNAVLLNTARGELIDERALARQLSQGKFSRVILDVREIEPPPQPDPLAEFGERVWLTPHLAGLSDPALERTSLMILEEISRINCQNP